MAVSQDTWPKVEAENLEGGRLRSLSHCATDAGMKADAERTSIHVEALGRPSHTGQLRLLFEVVGLLQILTCMRPRIRLPGSLAQEGCEGGFSLLDQGVVYSCLLREVVGLLRQILAPCASSWLRRSSDWCALEAARNSSQATRA
mmetsp:Transcript_43617/g.138894  ORF Transcript_43617/g.138894 Transcript_43617/m.138894 type:complete len:145 (-) Transcript_43617:360-794(-)